MAATDNVRPQYQDGLVLGAAQLSGDQTYFRAALERRSLTRDMFGIVWGLDLTVETAPSGASTSAVVRVLPGVAYGGDGKAIVLRDEGEVSSLLQSSGAQPGSSWAVYISYTETSQSGQSGFSFCGQAMDPTVTEGSQFAVELVGATPPDGQRDGPRTLPQGVLGGTSDATMDRVMLGVVVFDSTGQPSVSLVPGQVAIPASTATPPTQASLAAANAPPAQAEYAGVLASGIAHPRAWAGTMTSGKITPAIGLEPESGIHLWQKTVLEADAYATGLLLVDGPVVANSGMAIVQPVDSSITGATPATGLLSLAVAFRTDGVVLADNVGGISPIDDSAHVLGIAMAAHDDQGTQVRIVFSGIAVAKLTVTPSTLKFGEWLVLDSKGKLTTASTPPTAGTLVAKFLAIVDDGAKVAKVLVSLA